MDEPKVGKIEFFPDSKPHAKLPVFTGTGPDAMMSAMMATPEGGSFVPIEEAQKESTKERRCYWVLQAAAILLARGNYSSPNDAVREAVGLLLEAERLLR